MFNSVKIKNVVLADEQPSKFSYSSSAYKYSVDTTFTVPTWEEISGEQVLVKYGAIEIKGGAFMTAFSIGAYKHTSSNMTHHEHHNYDPLDQFRRSYSLTAYKKRIPFVFTFDKTKPISEQPSSNYIASEETKDAFEIHVHSYSLSCYKYLYDAKHGKGNIYGSFYTIDNSPLQGFNWDYFTLFNIVTNNNQQSVFKYESTDGVPNIPLVKYSEWGELLDKLSILEIKLDKFLDNEFYIPSNPTKFVEELYGKDWIIDILEQLKIENVTAHKADYGSIPDLKKVNFNNDVVFTWNGTTSGVRVPDAKWIPDNREGLTICDATSGIFSMDIDFNKLDVITWSWQKVLGGEAAHGMLALSPHAIKRLETHTPSWPIPKLFRLANKKKLIKGIFEGSTINTPSMICVEDVIDSLNWVESVGGTPELIKISNENLKIVEDWVSSSNWVKFMNDDKKTRSSTSITLVIKDEWFKKFNEDEQKDVIKKVVSKLDSEGVAKDIIGYPKAPPSLRLWGGATVQNNDMKTLLPWIDWAYNSVKNNA